jgi:hypothetical protein
VRFPGRQTDNASVDKSDAATRHCGTDLDGSLWSDSVAFDKQSLETGIQDFAGNVLCSVWRANAQNNRAFAAQFFKRSCFAKPELRRAISRRGASAFGNPEDVATAVLCGSRDGDAHLAWV